MPKVRRPYTPVPDLIARQHFFDAMEEVRREDIAHFKSLCTGHRTLIRRLIDGSLIAISRRGRQYKLSVACGDRQFDSTFDTLDAAIQAVISSAEELDIDWRVNGEESACDYCRQCQE